MIDHVTIRVPELDEGRRFYALALELVDFPGAPTTGDGFVEWNDFSIAAASDERPPTRRLHVGFRAASREQVDAWWEGMTAAGAPDDGPPGPRPQYSSDYYGAFVLDPAGNSVEAVHGGRSHPGVIDHLWLRVRSLADATRFYETVAPTVDHEVRRFSGRTQLRGSGASFSLVEGEPTENVHLAFAAPDRETVETFHAAGVGAGYRSVGEPGERPQYHAGYYGAYLADPDGNNVEAVFHDR